MFIFDKGGWAANMYIHFADYFRYFTCILKTWKIITT